MQSINFYFDEYRPKPLSFDSRFAGVVIAVSLVMMVIIGLIKSNHISKQEQTLATKQKELKAIEQQVVALQKQLVSGYKAESLDNQIVKQQKNLTSYRKILANMQQPAALQSTKYSQILAQLGEQKGTSVWLTKINIQAQNLTLQGTTVDTQAIPLYVDLLKNADTLKRQFDELKVDRDPENSRLINFSLINGRLSNGQ